MFLGARISVAFRFITSEVSCSETLLHILLIVVKTFSFKIKIKQHYNFRKHIKNTDGTIKTSKRKFLWPSTIKYLSFI